jgi:hypothetical protein
MSITPRPPEPQPEPTVVIALRAMGLRSDDLRAAVLAGHNEAARVTANDVATLGGYLRWATPLRFLGDRYVSEGFRRVRPGGFEVLRSPDEAFDIGVAAGTLNTGILGAMPSTRIERGPLTGQAVDFNRGQMRFDANVIPFGPREPRPETTPSVLTWLLLHFYDEPADELRLELSVPVEFTRTRGTDNERGTVTRFDPRLILPSIALAADAAIRDEDEDDGDDEIDIPVDRRD